MVQFLLCKLLSIVLNFTGERHEYIQIRTPLLCDLPLEFLYITNRMETGRCNHHSFCLAADLVACHVAKVFEHDGGLLSDVMRMQRFIVENRFDSSHSIQLWIVWDRFDNFVVHPVGHIIFEDIQNEVFLNRLPHGVDVEGVPLVVLANRSKHL